MSDSEVFPNFVSVPVEQTTGNNQQWLRSVVLGVVVYLGTLIPVVAGVVAGFEVLEPGRDIPYGKDSLLLRFAAWDGGQFMHIMEAGYQYRADKMSNIVMFPGYPILGWFLRQVAGFSPAASLLFVSHICLLAALVLYHRLIRLRFGRDQIADVSLLVLAALPTTFFWRMAYSESPFVLLEVLFLYGIHRNWSCGRLAVLVALASSFRLVGLALLIPLAMEFASQSSGCTSQQRATQLRRGILLLAVSLSGLGGFMCFLWVRFGDPLVFARGQESFCLRQPVGALEHWYRLATLEPIWGTYTPSSDCFWHRHSPSPGPLLNLQFWNPIWFCLACGLVFTGWFRRILTDSESVLGAALLLIPYLGRAEEFCMGSQARYSSVAIPAMTVLGHSLSRLPTSISAVLLIAGVSMLTWYSALFGAWYFLL